MDNQPSTTSQIAYGQSAKHIASFPGFPLRTRTFYVRPTRPQGKAWERGYQAQTSDFDKLDGFSIIESRSDPHSTGEQIP